MPDSGRSLFGFLARGVSKQNTSWGGAVGGEFDPDRLVRKRRSESPGACSRATNGSALRCGIVPGKCWGPSHWLKATRLLGRQPGDALGDRDVALILIGSLEPGALGARAFRELAGDIALAQLKRFRKRVEAAWPELFDADGPTNCREMLIEFVDTHIERWDAEIAAREENAEKEVKREIYRLGVDRDKEGSLKEASTIRSAGDCFSAALRTMKS